HGDRAGEGAGADPFGPAGDRGSPRARGRDAALRGAARRREGAPALRVPLGADDRRSDRDGRLPPPAAPPGARAEPRDPSHAPARVGENDVRSAATKAFRDANRTVITLAHDPGAPTG